MPNEVTGGAVPREFAVPHVLDDTVGADVDTIQELSDILLLAQA